MSNVTAKPGQMASFKCQVDMSCIVAYIEWYHEMDNGTEKLIKVGILFQLSLLETVIGMSSWNIGVSRDHYIGTLIWNLYILLQTASSSGDPRVHIIKQVKATDEGLYTCIAGNVLGQVTTSAYLEVVSK